MVVIAFIPIRTERRRDDYFFAAVESYTKGYLGVREIDEDRPISKDFTLCIPHRDKRADNHYYFGDDDPCTDCGRFHNVYRWNSSWCAVRSEREYKTRWAKYQAQVAEHEAMIVHHRMFVRWPGSGRIASSVDGLSNATKIGDLTDNLYQSE
jgi:hypothetical protein